MRENHKTFQVGEARITQLVEIHPWLFPARKWFPGLTAAQLSSARERYPAAVLPDGVTWAVSLRNHVIEFGGQTIVVDTCAGNHKDRPGSPEVHQLDTDYLDRFAQAGFDPERVDVVVSTHLHFDHCGWNTRLVDGEWVPTFPNAVYLFDSVELASALQRGQDEPGGDSDHVYRDSIAPVLERAQHEVVEPGGTVLSFGGTTVVTAPTPGHTPGHLVVEVQSGDGGVILSGDVLHHPFQVQDPDQPHFADADPAQAARTRRELLARCADEGFTLLSAHLVLDSDSPWQEPLGVVRNGTDAFAWR